MSNETPTIAEIRLRNEGEREALTRILALIENGFDSDRIKKVILRHLKTMDDCEAIYKKVYDLKK